MVFLKKKVTGISRAALESFSAQAQSAVALRGEVSVLIAGDEELRRLNRCFRGRNRATDVLSFAGPEEGIAGDIAISAKTAARNARLLGHSLADELKILILHGILHLAGYDHERDHGEMARCERSLRQQMGLPDSRRGGRTRLTGKRRPLPRSGG